MNAFIFSAWYQDGHGEEEPLFLVTGVKEHGESVWRICIHYIRPLRVVCGETKNPAAYLSSVLPRDAIYYYKFGRKEIRMGYVKLIEVLTRL